MAETPRTVWVRAADQGMSQDWRYNGQRNKKSLIIRTGNLFWHGEDPRSTMRVQEPTDPAARSALSGHCLTTANRTQVPSGDYLCLTTGKAASAAKPRFRFLSPQLHVKLPGFPVLIWSGGNGIARRAHKGNIPYSSHWNTWCKDSLTLVKSFPGFLQYQIPVLIF